MSLFHIADDLPCNFSSVWWTSSSWKPCTKFKLRIHHLAEDLTLWVCVPLRLSRCCILRMTRASFMGGKGRPVSTTARPFMSAKSRPSLTWWQELKHILVTSPTLSHYWCSRLVYPVTGMKTSSSPVLLSLTTGVLGLYTRWQELKHILVTSSTLTTGGLGVTRNSGSCANGSAVCSTQWNKPGSDGHLILNGQPTAQVTPAQNASNRRQKWA